jgi:hypothetical protein
MLSTKQDCFCLRPASPGQSLLLPQVALAIGRQLATQGQNCLLIMDSYESFDEDRRLLAKQAQLPHQALQCFSHSWYN